MKISRKHFKEYSDFQLDNTSSSVVYHTGPETVKYRGKG
jgi:hypothetical protein